MLKETASPLNGFFYFDFLRERGFKWNIYRCLLPQYIKKQKYILLYTYTTTSSHNQPNPISPTTRPRFACLPAQPCPPSLFCIQTFLRVQPYTKYDVSDLPQVILVHSIIFPFGVNIPKRYAQYLLIIEKIPIFVNKILIKQNEL